MLYQSKVPTLKFVLARVVTLTLTPFLCLRFLYEYKATVSGNTSRLMLAHSISCHLIQSARHPVFKNISRLGLGPLRACGNTHHTIPPPLQSMSNYSGEHKTLSIRTIRSCLGLMLSTIPHNVSYTLRNVFIE